MQHQTRTIPEFADKNSEAAYWLECEKRGRAVMFWLICGSNIGGLALAENDAAALWSVQWNELAQSQRRHLCLSLARFPLMPDSLHWAHLRDWYNLTDGEREHVCAYTRQLAQECRRFMHKSVVDGMPALLREQAQ